MTTANRGLWNFTKAASARGCCISPAVGAGWFLLV